MNIFMRAEQIPEFEHVDWECSVLRLQTLLNDEATSFVGNIGPIDMDASVGQIEPIVEDDLVNLDIDVSVGTMTILPAQRDYAAELRQQWEMMVLHRIVDWVVYQPSGQTSDASRVGSSTSG